MKVGYRHLIRRLNASKERKAGKRPKGVRTLQINSRLSQDRQDDGYFKESIV